MQRADTKLIIVRLSGGLGNQLFQYGFAKALENRSGATVKIDIGYLDSAQPSVTRRKFSLDNFSISLPTARTEDLRRIGIPNLNTQDVMSKIQRKLFFIKEFFIPDEKKKIVFEKKFTFDPTVLSITRNAYFLGSWLSPRYFEDIRPILLKEITLAGTPSPAYERIALQIRDSVSVAIHVRRGDYLRYPKFAVCSPEYYRNAISYMNSKLADPSFFVFSDDIEYVQEHMDFGEHVTYVSSKHLQDYEELMLMSACRHSIIANSSFGWWAAWLNQHKDKIIIAPKEWKTNGTDMSDYLPASLEWMRM